MFVFDFDWKKLATWNSHFAKCIRNLHTKMLSSCLFAWSRPLVSHRLFYLKNSFNIFLLPEEVGKDKTTHFSHSFIFPLGLCLSRCAIFVSVFSTAAKKGSRWVIWLLCRLINIAFYLFSVSHIYCLQIACTGPLMLNISNKMNAKCIYKQHS